MVSLSLTPFTPMAYRRKGKDHFCFLLVSLAVSTWAGVIFTDSNAAGTTMQRRGEGPSGLNYINFEAIRSLPRPGDREGWVRPVQAEVLVPDSIPLAYIPEISFVSQASLAHAERLCGSLPHPKFSVNAQLFTNSSQASLKTIMFPYVAELVLTADTNIDQSMLYSSHIQENKYSKSRDKCIILSAIIDASPGTKVNFELSTASTDRRVVKTRKLEVQGYYPNGYIDRSRIRLENLQVGVYSVACYLNDLCWASANFEVLE